MNKWILAVLLSLWVTPFMHARAEEAAGEGEKPAKEKKAKKAKKDKPAKDKPSKEEKAAVKKALKEFKKEGATNEQVVESAKKSWEEANVDAALIEKRVAMLTKVLERAEKGGKKKKKGKKEAPAEDAAGNANAE